MHLRRRLGGENGNGSPVPNLLLAAKSNGAEVDRYQVLKKQLHRELISKLDLAALENLGEAERRAQVERVARWPRPRSG